MLNPGAPSPFLLVGDHAGRETPAALGDMGVAAEDWERHIAWDIGVAGLGASLAALLDAAFVRQRYSRLVIDCNRDPGRPDAICEVSDGTTIPANQHLTPAERARRVDEIVRPYHAAIAGQLDQRAGRRTCLVALHSFTPVMDAFARPWRFGVLHLEDSPLSRAVLARLRAEPLAGEVGDNQPYRMDGTDFTVPHHAHARGLDYVELEVRQDLIAAPAGQAEVADLLARVLTRALEDLGPA
ncbi:N-formylglutamate amidohydrolase [Phenylobacterium sp. J367]|uniref:N-formylglutamate amidohydrolase n=1 Tax=Phenylobacterium sp. J367 TaxID=2898435 RepID=UPI0021506F93|nr:N-formylglutamate amidohydrolase [Phenylobacterium sp. J367]MCR5879312.1 N-formylglutamate amidohydrolase [Phenylobacterium sp. J367]